MRESCDKARRLKPLSRSGAHQEITRRVNRENIWQAVYTAGVVLPRPISECRALVSSAAGCPETLKNWNGNRMTTSNRQVALVVKSGDWETQTQPGSPTPRVTRITCQFFGEGSLSQNWAAYKMVGFLLVPLETNQKRVQH